MQKNSSGINDEVKKACLIPSRIAAIVAVVNLLLLLSIFASTESILVLMLARASVSP